MASCRALCSIRCTLRTVLGASPLWPLLAVADSLAAATLEQVGVEVVELHGGEGLQLDLAEDRSDVGGGVGAVVGPGGGAQPRLHRREPLFMEGVSGGG